MSKIPKKYTIDKVKNDIQNLQSQNLYDFQEIKRLDNLIKEYDTRILEAINFNILTNKKIQSQISLILDRIKNLENNSSSSNESGLTTSQTDQLNVAYTHSQSYHVTKQELQSLNSNVNTIINNLNTHINSKHLSQTDVENIVNELIDGIQTQISLILDRIKNLENNSPSTPTVKTYSVTYNLNNVTCSNNTTSITENSRYNTSLTPYDSYSISNVTVTVGGVNVTADVYSNGVINIDNVTGNIVITVTAVVQNDNIVECKNGTVSFSDGSETEDETRIVTDFIPVEISGDLSISIKTTERYSYVVRYFDEDKKFEGTGGNKWNLVGSTITLKPYTGVNFSNVKYLRVVFKLNSDDKQPINTINGTIEIEEDGNVKTLIMKYN